MATGIKTNSLKTEWGHFSGSEFQTPLGAVSLLNDHKGCYSCILQMIINDNWLKDEFSADGIFQ